MSKEPKTIGELFFYMEGEFTTIRAEMKNMKRFIYWVAGISGASSATIFLGVCKLVGVI